MFEIDFSRGEIISEAGRVSRRPGEVLFTRDGAMAQIDRARRDGPQEPPRDPLDSHEAQALHGRLMATYRYELERQGPNRAEMALDEDFYDHLQWSTEELAVLRDRGQAPIVFNLIQTTVNWVLGSQRRSTMDHRVLPRRAEGLKAAERKSELLRHLRDENHSGDHLALAFADAVKAGIGWLETAEGDPTDGPIVIDRHESWRNMLWDSRGVDGIDIQAGRYVCRSKWLDQDMAVARWPGRAGIIRASTEQSIMSGGLSEYGDDAMDSREDDANFGSSIVTSGGMDLRQRVRVVEMWFKQPVGVPVMQGGDFQRELFDPWSEGHWTDLQEGRASLVERTREVVHVALMTERGILDVRQSPYRHNQFPFTAIWGYRRSRDGMPYGIIRGLRDINRDLNKRASKAQHILSAVRVSVKEGAVDDIEELRNEAGRPDAVIVSKLGAPDPIIETDHALADSHISLMSMDAQMIQQVGGVTDENLGRKTNATSGKAIIARQDQGALATSIFFDNLRFATRLHGEKKLVNIEQFYTDAQSFRITDARGNPQYITINDGSFSNAISLFKADFILDEEDWRATTRQAQAAQLLELMQQLAATAPQVVLQCLDLLIEALDMPKRDEIVKRIRQITGVSNPDEDPNNPTPETQARQQQEAEQAEMAKRAAVAELDEKEAKAANLKAEAARNWMGLSTDNIDQINAAVEAAIKLGGAPAVGGAVDQMLRLAKQEAYAMGLQDAAQQQPEPQMPAEAMPQTFPEAAEQGVMQQ